MFEKAKLNEEKPGNNPFFKECVSKTFSPTPWFQAMATVVTE